MKKIIFYSLLAVVLISCQNQEKSIETFKYIPEDASVIIQTPNLKNLKQYLKEFSFIKENKFSAKDHIDTKLSFLKRADSLTEALITISVSEKDNLI